MLALVCLVLSAVVGGDSQAQYGVADSGYDAPSTGYDSNSYAAPTATGYSAPSASYDYGGYDQGGYAATQEDGGLDLSKLTSLIPIFVVVFAAIILAQLIAPLFTQLLSLILMVIPGALSFKAPIINVLLNPLGLQLCDLNDPPMAFPAAGKRSFEGISRAFDTNKFFDAEQFDTLVSFVDEAVSAYSNMDV